MSVKILRWILIGLGVVALLATLLPFVPTNAAAVRVWDFPRLQVAAVLAIVLGALVAMPRREKWTWVFAASLGAALAWQVHWIWPYTPLATTEAKRAESCAAESRVTLVVANVLIDNRDVAPLLALVERTDPDMVLLVETDAWWDEQLSPLKEAYAHGISHPQEDSYGIHLSSRFPLIEPEVRFLIQDYVPSIKTGVRLRSGARINLYGLHPMPPPHQDTERRDAELLIVGQEVHREPTPAIVAGDLNDVAWSRSNSLFQEVSGLLDPRIGRGVYATFSTDWPLVRFPLDYVFFERSFQLLELEVLEHIGSDHFPLFIALCFRPEGAGAQQPPPPEGSAVEEADDAIREGHEEAADD